MDRQWVARAVGAIRADAHRSADTHLIRLDLPRAHRAAVYLKDESTHPTGSLKHRLARSLFLYGLCNGRIGPGTTIVEASSGSTAISEAYFARMLGLPFVAVMAASTSPEKIALIEREGGRCDLVPDSCAVYDRAAQVAAETDGVYLDQFSHAERATDWRGNNNIAESIFSQLDMEEHPVPQWVVVGAGTGGTSATIGRYTRYQALPTKLCLVDPEGSAFAPHLRERWTGRAATTPSRASRIEGIGRSRVEPSFIPDVVDRVITVPDAASVAAMNLLRHAGIDAGPSTGTNLIGVLRLACEVKASGAAGSIVSLVCDAGSRYTGSYRNQQWLAEQGLDPQPVTDALQRAWEEGIWDEQILTGGAADLDHATDTSR